MTARTRPAPSGTSKTVQAGQAASRTRSRQSTARVAANAKAVEKLNDAKNEPTRVELVKQALALGVKGASAMKKDDLVRRIAVEQKATAATAGEANALDLAHVEQQAVKQWEKDGKKGDRPATPHLDELLARTPGASASKPRKPKGEGRSSKLGERGRAGAEKMKAAGGRRGRGKKLTPDELLAYCTKVAKAHPTTTALDELYFAHWCEGIAVSKPRFFEAFDAAKKAAKKAA